MPTVDTAGRLTQTGHCPVDLVQFLTRLLAVLLLVMTGVAFGSGASVVVKGGRLIYLSPAGDRVELAKGINVRSAVLSADARLIAFIRVLTPEDETREGRSELWICDAQSGSTRRLQRSIPSTDPSENLSWFDHPMFSLDQRAIYVTALAWADEDAVHRVDLATGTEQFVVDGDLEAIIRSGQYAGDLAVSRHTALPDNQIGFYYPLYVVQPSGQVLFRIPGTGGNRHRAAFQQWLRQNRSAAW